jgi:aspartate-semialdehyde dehydrogenase
LVRSCWTACGRRATFDLIRPVFFSTSDAGGRAPLGGEPLQDASDLDALGALDLIITCQGGDYTSDVYPRLRRAGWTGYWIDARPRSG